MNALARWKVVLALIATFAAGAITGGFLTGRVIKDAMRHAEQARQPSALTVDRLRKDLHLKTEQADKLGPVLTQMDDELSNPYVRSICAKRMESSLAQRLEWIRSFAPEQRQQLQQILDEHRRHFEEALRVPETPH
jgi:hypothetical protein